MNKRRNRRNWFILVLIAAMGLILALNNFGWQVSLFVSAVIALVSYWSLTRLGVL